MLTASSNKAANAERSLVTRARREDAGTGEAPEVPGAAWAPQRLVPFWGSLSLGCLHSYTV